MEPDNVDECLKKSYNLCMVCKVTKNKSTDLFTMLLNKYIYYYEKLDLVFFFFLPPINGTTTKSYIDKS